jgi:hypothetical protein
MPQIKTAIIEDVLNERHWDGSHGRVYYSTLVMDNGERGEIGAKKQDAYSIGQELTYTSEATDRGLKFKRYFDPSGSNAEQGQKPQGQQSNPQPTVKNFGGRGSEASFALSYAKDFIGKAMEIKTLAHEGDPVSVNQWVEAVLVTAAKFNQFLKENGNG